MADVKFVDDDFLALRAHKAMGEKPRLTLAFGDAVEVLEEDGDWKRVRALTHFEGRVKGFVPAAAPLRDQGVLKLSMVDVQQGDGMILETPAGKVVFIDGGDNKLFARHAAARFLHRASSAEAPLAVEALFVTHGDADHFDGLNDIFRSESLSVAEARKRLFIHPKRVFHNGLVKGPSSLPDREIFGRTVERDGRRFIVDLFDDPRTAAPEARNRPFKLWTRSLDGWEQRGPISFRRVAFGMDPGQLFGFLEAEGIGVEIQGPFEEKVTDPATGETVSALPYLPKPRKSAEIHLEDPGDPGGTPSASHTINGHSIALRLTFGNVRFNLTGDLNRDSMARMRQEIPLGELEAEIVKVPHHGSHDFDFRALAAMKPVVAMISSGDEHAGKEHIHPRATLMSAVGKVMRGDTGVVFNTELAAFFATKDYCHTRKDLAEFFQERAAETFTGEELRQLFTGQPKKDVDPPGLFFGFERTNFGIIHLRTDGERVLVFTHSGKKGLNEAYRFAVTMENGERKITFAREVTTR